MFSVVSQHIENHGSFNLVWHILDILPHLSCRILSSQTLYSTTTGIIEFDFDTQSATVLLEHGRSYVFAIDYDYQNRYIYFPRYNYNDIVRFAYPSNNTTLQTVVQSLSVPTGIAVDSANHHLYWIEYGPDRLLRCNLDGSNVTVLSTLNDPRVIRLDVTNRLDLSEQHVIVSFTSTETVQCMDTDTKENRLYWINYDGDMQSANDNGSDVNTIHSTNVEVWYSNVNNTEIVDRENVPYSLLILYR
ncbi:unnamed protein product [Mytilus edulis]|uniref:LRP5_6 n=1 Tax=Mytilus edulis TaxID=6550 RepID=A0A8S3QWB3_MYTED|nr:unnamed protein product [Mytilus edulis]